MGQSAPSVPPIDVDIDKTGDKIRQMRAKIQGHGLALMTPFISLYEAGRHHKGPSTSDNTFPEVEASVPAIHRYTICYGRTQTSSCNLEIRACIYVQLLTKINDVDLLFS